MIHHEAMGLRKVLTDHMLAISRLTTDAKDAYLDLSREVTFFVETGYWEYLAKDANFRGLWNQRHDLRRTIPPGMSLQEANYHFDMAIYGLACGIYTKAGLLLPAPTPFDAPEEEMVPG